MKKKESQQNQNDIEQKKLQSEVSKLDLEKAEMKKNLDAVKNELEDERQSC